MLVDRIAFAPPSEVSAKERETRRGSEQLASPIGVDQIALRHRACTDGQRGGEVRQDREAEDVTLAEVIDHPAFVGQVYDPGLDHEEAMRRLTRLSQDHCVRLVRGDLDMFGKIGQVMTVELAEGRKPFEECRDPRGCRSIP
jgi:hypothetical protein